MPQRLMRHPRLLIVGGAILVSFGLPYVLGEAQGGVPPLPLAGALITIMVPAGFIAFGTRKRSVISGLVLLALALAAGVIVIVLIESESLDLGGLIGALLVLTGLGAVVAVVLTALLVRLVVNAVRRRRGVEVDRTADSRAPHPEDGPVAGQPASPSAPESGNEGGGSQPAPAQAAADDSGNKRRAQDNDGESQAVSGTRRVAWLAASGAGVVVLVLGLIGGDTVHGFVTDKILPALSTFGGCYAIITGALNRRQGRSADKPDTAVG